MNRNWWRKGLLGWLLGASLVANAATPDAQEFERLRNEVLQALVWGDFATLQRLHDEWSRPGQQLISGWPKLSAFREGIDLGMKSPRDGADLFHAELQALTQQWTREHPGSGLAHALHANALVAQAWSIRGSGLANTVPPQAWDDFHRLVKQAAEHLARAEGAISSTLTHGELLSIGRVLQFDERQLWALLDDGLRRNPEDLVLYRRALGSMLPKWGGSNVAVDRYIRRVTERTRERWGLSLYAWLYAAAASDEYRHRLFEDSGARWSDMAQGWRDLLARHPSATTHNRFAYFACLARDKVVFLEQLEAVGEAPDLEHWGANARRTFDTCKRWAQQQ
jgi:hypothetical protein